MLKKRGFLGIALLVFGNANFYFRIEPFAAWYIPIVWFGFIFLVDAVVHRLSGRSLMTSPSEFLFVTSLSVVFWMLFEVYDAFTSNWTYGIVNWYGSPYQIALHLVSYTTVMPAVLEAFTLFNVLWKPRPSSASFSIPRRPALLMAGTGAIAAMAPFILPAYGYPLVWVGLGLAFDPINSLRKKPSVVQELFGGNLKPMVKLFAAGIVCGLLWEAWNYLAIPQWAYTLPFISAPRLFAMPLPGYFGYLGFAIETFAFYAFFHTFFRDRLPEAARF